MVGPPLPLRKRPTLASRYCFLQHGLKITSEAETIRVLSWR
jgi:hypothetical protein